MSLIEQLRSQGRLDSRGEFTLDASKAADKLGRFQLSDTSRFLLEILATCHQLGVRSLRLFTMKGRAPNEHILQIVFEELVLGPQMPANLSEHLLIPSSPLQRLAVALNALESSGVRQVWTDEQNRQWDSLLTPSSPKEEVSRPISLELFSSNGQLFQTSLDLLRSPALIYADFPIHINGQPLQAQLPQGPWGDYRFEDSQTPGRVCHITLSQASSRPSIRMVKFGVAYEDEAPPNLAAFPFVAVCCDNQLPLDAAFAKLVEGDELTAARQALETAFWEHLTLAISQNPLSKDLRNLVAPHLQADHLLCCPALQQMDFFRASDGQYYSLQQLELWEHHDACLDDGVETPPQQLCLRPDANMARLLKAYFGSRYCDKTDEYRILQQNNLARQAFLKRSTETTALQGPTGSNRTRRTNKAANPEESVHWTEYELGIDGSPGECSLRVHFQQRFLFYLTPKSNFPYQCVIDFDRLNVNGSYTDVYDRAVLKPILELLENESQRLYEALLDPASPKASDLDRLRAILRERKSASQLPLYNNSPLFPSVLRQPSPSANPSDSRQWTRVSMIQIRKFYRQELTIGFLDDPRLLPDQVPPAAWKADLILFIDQEERSLICNFLGIKVSKMADQLPIFKELQQRFANKVPVECPDPASRQYQRLTRKQEGKILCLVIGPPQPSKTSKPKGSESSSSSSYDWGSLWVNVLCNGIEIEKLRLNVAGPGGYAVLEHPTLPVGPGWKGIVQGPEWQAARNWILDAYQELLPKIMGHLKGETFDDNNPWTACAFALLSQKIQGSEHLPVWQTERGPMSLHDFEAFKDKTMALVSPKTSSKVVSQLRAQATVDLLVTDAEGSRLRFEFLQKFNWVDIQGEEFRLQALAEFRKQPATFGQSPDKALCSCSYRALGYEIWLWLLEQPDSLVSYYKENILVATVSGPKSYLAWQVQHPDFQLTNDCKRILPGPLLKAVEPQLIEAWRVLIQKQSSKILPQQILRWLEGPERPEILREIAAFETLEGQVSLNQLKDHPRQGSDSRLLVLNPQEELPGTFAGDQFVFSGESPDRKSFSWPKENRPTVLMLHPQLEPFRLILMEFTGRKLVSALKPFQALVQQQLSQVRFESRRSAPPSCWLIRNIQTEQGYLGIPVHQKDQGVYILTPSEEEPNSSISAQDFSEFTPGYPLCGAFRGSNHSLREEIGQLYFQFFSTARSFWELAKKVNLSEMDRYWNLAAYELDVRLAFCNENRDELLRWSKKPDPERDPAAWQSQLLEFAWIPAENGTRVSLQEIRRFEKVRYLEQDWPLSQLEQLPDFEGRKHPWLVVQDPQLRQFLGGWCRHALDPVVLNKPEPQAALSHYLQRSWQASKDITSRLTRSIGKLFVKAPPPAPTTNKKAPNTSLPSKPVVTKSDEQLLGAALTREASRCLSGRLLAIMKKELTMLTTAKHLWGPAVSFDKKLSRLHLNVSHPKIRQVLANLEDPRQVLSLLLLVLGQVNLQREELTDRQEEQALDDLLEKMAQVYAA